MDLKTNLAVDQRITIKRMNLDRKTTAVVHQDQNSEVTSLEAAMDPPNKEQHDVHGDVNMGVSTTKK